MAELASWYLPLKSLHIGLVLASGGLFALRGALLLAGQGWALARPWRLLSYVLDTLLLAAGATLWALLSLNPLVHTWLGAKLMLLLFYIVLGSLAFKRAPTAAARFASYVGALLVYALMASVAVAHHPLGLLQPWLAPGG